MSIQEKILAGVVITLAIVLLLAAVTPRAASERQSEGLRIESVPAIVEVAPEPVDDAPRLTHAQETWIRALEWCESRGNPEAVNPLDTDGTSSYGAFQFKAATFDYYRHGIFNLEKAELMDRNAQYEVVVRMVLAYDRINWHQQFPACVRQLGMPPRA